MAKEVILMDDVDGLGDTGIHHLLQARNVDGHHHVGRRTVTFALQFLDHALVDKSHVDRDAGFLGEGIEQRLHEFGLAMRIDVHLVGKGRRGKRCKGQGQKRKARVHG